MKNKFVKILLIFSIFIGAAQLTQAQVRIYVKARPAVTVVTRPAPPHPGYVWVADEWRGNGAAYERVEGHWVAPRRGFVWIAGHWVNERRGYYWVPGHWRRA